MKSILLIILITISVLPIFSFTETTKHKTKVPDYVLWDWVIGSYSEMTENPKHTPKQPLKIKIGHCIPKSLLMHQKIREAAYLKETEDFAKQFEKLVTIKGKIPFKGYKRAKEISKLLKDYRPALKEAFYKLKTKSKKKEDRLTGLGLIEDSIFQIIHPIINELHLPFTRFMLHNKIIKDFLEFTVCVRNKTKIKNTIKNRILGYVRAITSIRNYNEYVSVMVNALTSIDDLIEANDWLKKVEKEKDNHKKWYYYGKFFGLLFSAIGDTN